MIGWLLGLGLHPSMLPAVCGCQSGYILVCVAEKTPLASQTCSVASWYVLSQHMVNQADLHGGAVFCRLLRY